jgi:hypothetical protein
MTPKEKAKELVEKYSFVEIPYHTSMFEIKQCALIAVDEIINNAKDFLHWMPCDSEVCGCKEYWIKVKHEIKKL